MYGARNSDSTSYTTIECRRRPHVSAWEEALGRGNLEEMHVTQPSKVLWCPI